MGVSVSSRRPCSARLQVGGFSSKTGAQRALQNKLARLLPGRRAVTLTFGEWVKEYLEAHQGERVTVAKLRWLLGKATAGLGDVRLTALSPEQVCGWRLTVPEGHRFEATQALRQVLNRAVAWKLLDENPAKRVPNPGPRCREQRPFESWGADPVACRAAGAEVRADEPPHHNACRQLVACGLLAAPTCVDGDASRLGRRAGWCS